MRRYFVYALWLHIHKFFQERDFVYVHTPIITGSDGGRCEMFHVTTLDLNEVPRTDQGQVDYSQDFFKNRPILQ